MRGVLRGLRFASRLNVRAHPFAALVLLAPGLSLAQTLPISVATGGVIVNGVTRFGPIHCGTTFTVQWGIPTPAQITTMCSTPEFWITAGTCGDHPASGDITLTPTTPIDLNSTRSGTFNPVNVNDLPIFQTSDGGGACGSRSGNLTLYICGSVSVPNTSFSGCGSTSIVRGTNPQIQYRGSPPAVPSCDVAPLDGALRVSSSAGSDVNLTHAELREQGVGDFAEVASFTPDQGSVKVGGLQNGTPYEVRCFADDGVGNNSDRSGVVVATPVASDGFYENYRRLGGEEKGGCGSALPAALGLPLVMGAYRLLRRKR